MLSQLPALTALNGLKQSPGIMSAPRYGLIQLHCHPWLTAEKVNQTK